MGVGAGIGAMASAGMAPRPAELEGTEQAHLCHQAFCDTLGGVTSTNPDHAYSKPSLAPWHNGPEQQSR